MHKNENALRYVEETIKNKSLRTQQIKQKKE